MANTVRIKRRSSGAAGAPSSLANAELAFNEVDDILYYGKGTGGAGGTATTIETIGGKGAFVTLTGEQTISGKKIYSGPVDFSGATVSGFTVNGNFSIVGDLTVSGTTTTVNSTTVTVDDKNIELGSVASPTDTTADGGGITLKGTTDKTINWVDATDAWTFSEHVDLASAKEYRIAGTKVLDATSLGSAVVSSSLTSVGTITSGTWNGTTVGTAYGGTGQSTYTDGQLLIGNSATSSLSKATLTAGAGVTITNGNGTITIASTGTTYTAGDGLDLVGTEFSVDLKANGGLVVESTELAIDLGASAITGTLAVGDGGTGAANAADARVNLDLEIGVDVQAYSAVLTAIGGLTPGDGGFIVGNGTAFVVESGSTARTSLGLGTMAVQDANNVAITGGLISATATISGATIDAVTIDCGEF